MQKYAGKLAVLSNDELDKPASEALAIRLGVSCHRLVANLEIPESLFLTWRDGCLKLLDQSQLKKGGLMVEIDPRPGEQRSWPAPKDGALAQALGRKTKSVIDATTGWGQDSLHIFRMGYDLRCIERSPVMQELLKDGFKRLTEQSWMQQLQLTSPELLCGNAIELLSQLTDPPDCIYIDPMFPPKRKKSALAKKAMLILRDLLGDDEDKALLFDVALQTTGKKVVVKSPTDAEPLGGKPQASYNSKLLRYDVYTKN